ncbi:MAG: thioredoxin TrxC [Magnetococcales bacterium]|nr:thioredoxin TrxC [Magnetococcales bacterium]
MSEALTIVCPSCGVTNRIASEKVGFAAKCGKCGETLPENALAHPIAVNDSEFQKEVIQSPIPVLVDYWASWCMPCRQLAPSLEVMAEEFAGRLKVAKVNTEENPVLAQRFQIHGVPTLIIFEKGRIKERISGALPVGQLRNWIKKSMGWF